MKLLQLKYFLTICEYSNISRAAGKLHVSQPSLTAAMKSLEQEFGITLFHRQSRGLILTEEGEIFRKEAAALMEHADLFSEKMMAMGTKKQDIRLGVSPMLSILLFPALVQSFHQAYPDARIQMVENGSVTNKSMVLDGMLDAAIIASDSPPSSVYGSCPLLPVHICLYLSSTHPLRDRASLTLADTTGIPLALLAEDSFLTTFLYKMFSKKQITPDVLLHTNQLAAIRQLISLKTAGSFLFDHVLEEDSDIVKIPVSDLPQIQTYLIWNTSQPQNAGIRHLIQTARYFASSQLFPS